MRLAANKLRLIITGECNLSCFYCHNEGQSRKSFYMPLSTVTSLTTSLENLGVPVDEVTISGGEPALHPNLVQIVGRISMLSTKVSIVSNGLLLSGTTMDLLRSAGLRKLRLGVDSLRPNKPRPSPGFSTRNLSLSDTVQCAKSLDIDVDFNTVLTKFNATEVESLLKIALDANSNIKFFEHVDVDQFGTAAANARMSPKPHVDESLLVSALSKVMGHPPTPNYRAPFGLANTIYEVAGIEVRYCRYLCPYGLCWTTGTRLDPSKYVYTCMANHGIDQLISPGDKFEVAEVFGEAAARQCDARRVS